VLTSGSVYVPRTGVREICDLVCRVCNQSVLYEVGRCGVTLDCVHDQLPLGATGSTSSLQVQVSSVRGM